MMRRGADEDQPIRSPDADLLGTSVYAERLARHVNGIPWPFTLGVYGQWGEGKTSFVRLLHYHLAALRHDEPIEFIEFSAWPYTTADAVWRALGREVARCLCGISDSGNSTAANDDQPEQTGLLPSIRQFLFRDALVMIKPAEAPNETKYKEVIAALDTSAAVVMDRASSVRYDRLALASIGQILLQAAAPFAPWLSAAKVPKLDLSRALHSSTKLPAPVESIDQTRELFRSMFDHYGKGRRIVLFIDDLDRCLPEVALEVLEALKIFLAEAPCLFIVAADENLIGSGLRSRYHRAQGGEWQMEESAAAKKGREYFEKIIQLGVRVPQRGAEQAHYFVASQFPTWSCASDLLRILTDANPRRLKQICNLLSYKFSVAVEQLEPDRYGEGLLSTEDGLLFEKLIKCHTLSTKFMVCLNQEVERSRAAGKLLKEVERKATCAATGGTPGKGETQVDENSPELLSYLHDNYLLCVAIAESPRFSEFAASHVLELSEIAADLRPQDPDGLWRSGDRVLLRFLSDVSSPGGLPDLNTVLRLDLARVLELDQEFPAIAEALIALAQHRNWSRDVLAIERWVTEGTLAEASHDVIRQASLTIHRYLDDQAHEHGVKKVFSGTPRFSSMLGKVFKAYWKIRGSLPSPSVLVNKQLLATTPLEGQRRLVAKNAIELLPQDLRGELEYSLRLRQQTAVYLWAHRKFAKLETLAQGWPKLAARLFLQGERSLRDLESLAAENPPREFWPSPWQSYRRDERLCQFLLRPPSLADIDREDRGDFLAAVGSLPVEGEPQEAHGEEPGSMMPLTELELATAAISSLLPTAESYRQVEIEVMKKDDASEDFQLTIRAPWMSVDETATIRVPVELVYMIRERLDDIFLGDLRARTSVSSDQRGAFPDPALKEIKDLGSRLFQCLFYSGDSESETGRVFLKALKNISATEQESAFRVRLLMNVAAELSNVPWEILHLPPPVDKSPALSKHYSLVRYFPRESFRFSWPMMDSTLRVLAVLSSPVDVAPLDLEQEARILRRTLSAVRRSGSVELEIVELPTRENMMHRLRVFRPHVFHFVGHGIVLPENQGALVFSKDDGGAEPMEAERLGTLLTESSIRLAILNGCETGISGSQGVLSSVAGVLVENGIPAVVATVRRIVDRTALLFTQEFYRALVDGYPLELALTEARRALMIEKDDWVAYALFSKVRNLENFRFTGDARQRSDPS